VQQPQKPCGEQPSFTDVTPQVSRRTSRKCWSGSHVTVVSLPLRPKVSSDIAAPVVGFHDTLSDQPEQVVLGEIRRLVDVQMLLDDADSERGFFNA
jgi:hypothetical protein